MTTKNKKRARLALAELESEMEILNKEEMGNCTGGGDGTRRNPYTLNEVETLMSSGSFNGGWVLSASGYLTFYNNSGTATDTSSHWEKEGMYDIDNCSACNCGRTAKAHHGDPNLGLLIGQTINHARSHQDEYYKNYGECEKKRKNLKWYEYFF